MNIENIKNKLNKLMCIFPTSFINRNFELIIEPKNNIYFQLNNVESTLDFDCKVIAWLSRPSCKGLSDYWQRKIRKGFNEYFKTDFDKDEMMQIYTKLGNDIHRTLCEKFVQSGFDLSLLNDNKN